MSQLESNETDDGMEGSRAYAAYMDFIAASFVSISADKIEALLSRIESEMHDPDNPLELSDSAKMVINMLHETLQGHISFFTVIIPNVDACKSYRRFFYVATAKIDETRSRRRP